VKIFGWDIQRAQEQKTGQFEDVLQRIVAAQEGRGYGALVTPENCMASPTVHAIVTAISRRVSVSPVHVFQKTSTKGGLDSKERLPKHPVARLLAYPNSFQTRTSYWLDAASTFTRYGNFYAYKSRAATGPVKELLPLQYRALSVEQNERTWKVSYKINGEEVPQNKVHHVRGAARNFIEGDSPVNDVNVAIALEILAEKFGASFFQNGALPFLVFTWLQGSSGFKTVEDSKQFIADFQEAFGGGKRFRSMLAPKGMDKPAAVPIENDKAQFLETRKLQRTIIAGAFGVPPHLVGDLERATFNNVEQQDLDFTSNVIQPVTQAFEAAMERDLLTDEDVSSGVIIRFNLDSILRSDFKGRQEGLQIQKQNGAISANEWREAEGKNPISDEDGGNDYVRPANFVVAGKEPEPVAPADPIKQLDESIKNLQKAAQEMS
jgi:HK97 family phage portal protein